MNIGPARQTNWDWRAAGNFICGGSGSGLLIISTLMLFAGKADYLLVLTGAVLIMTGLALVWLEIGRPWRFLNVYRKPFSSWMARESWLATVLLPLALTTFWLHSPALALLMALFAALFLYSQSRILKAARSITAWRVSGIVPLIVSTGLLEGLGVVLISGIILPDFFRPHETFTVMIPALGLILCRAWFWFAYRNQLRSGAPTQTLNCINHSHRAFLLFGHILPGILVIMPLYIDGLDSLYSLSSGVCLLASGWAIKFVLITRAAYNQGYALSHSPARGAGCAGPGVQPGWSQAKT